MNEQDFRLLLSKFSHEVRNPVTLINSFLQLLVKEYPDIGSHPFYEKITENMLILTRLLDEVSRFNNADHLCRTRTDLRTFLQNITDSGNAALAPQGIRVTLNAEAALPCLFLDQSRMNQVFYNLLRNAAEAMETGGEITIHLTSGESQLQVEVANAGSEIPAEYLADLFEPFVTHKQEGTGLGLAICREIIQAHNGTISADSSNGLTVFTIQLPFSGNTPV